MDDDDLVVGSVLGDAPLGVGQDTAVPQLDPGAGHRGVLHQFGALGRLGGWVLYGA